MTHTETEPKRLLPKAEIEEVGPCKLKIRVEVGVDKVRERIEEKYRDLNDAVSLPGFRKGHTPRNLLERKFGKAILDDLKMEMVNDSFAEIREEKNLEPVALPDVDSEKLQVNDGEPFRFEMTLEVRPKIELKPYTGLPVTRAKVEVAETDVDQVLEDLREGRAELIPVTDEAREQDQLIGDTTLLVDGQEIDRGENNSFFLNEGLTFQGVPLKEFHRRFAGAKPGQTIEQEIELPAGFWKKEVAGKKAVVRIQIKGLKRKKLPEIDEAFAKAFDMDSLAELRESITKRVRRDKEEAARTHMANHLVDQILQTNEFPLPEGLIESGTEEAIRRLQLSLMLQGIPEEEATKRAEESKGESRTEMAKTLRRHFVLEQIAQKERIFVTEDQIQERINQMATQHGRWPHEMKNHLEEQELLPQLRRQMREELVLQFLLDKAVVEEAK